MAHSYGFEATLSLILVLCPSAINQALFCFTNVSVRMSLTGGMT
jgi:hypothetical protein